jgi:formylglycine-generating enzyme
MRFHGISSAVLVLLAAPCSRAVEPLPGTAPKVIRNSIGLSLVKVPAGEFLMGGQEPAEKLCAAFPEMKRTPDYFSDEYPQHRVHITKSFLIGQHEVTVGQFKQFTSATGYKTAGEADGTGGWGYDRETGKCVGRRPEFTWRDPGFTQSDDHPVVNVTWDDATAFCEWLSKKEGRRYRLPTEAEWEYACRAGANSRFYHGDDPKTLRRYAHLMNNAATENFAHIQDQVHHLQPGDSLTAKVGSYRPNPWGLHDTLGNVWEWTADWHSDDYYQHSPQADPRGPPTGDSRVRRGGAWNSFPMYTRAAFRNIDYPTSRCVNIGFRVVCEE